MIDGAPATVREVVVTDAAIDAPAAFTATMEKVVGVPLVSPLTAIGLEVAVKVSPVDVLVAMYLIIGEPLEVGAVKEIEAAPSEGAANKDVGVPGTLIGVTDALADDGRD